MSNRTPLILDPEEINSRLWQRIADELRRRIGVQRARNDNVDLDAVKTAATRGEINAYKSLIRLGEPRRPAEEPDA